MTPYEGIVNVLKAPGMTSSNVVSDIRHIFSEKRVGHTGTLDPGAAGVLPICIGRATRLFDYLVDKQKEYIAELSIGACTDTQDSYGTVTGISDTPVTLAMLEAVLPAFVGVQQQLPPKYSALKQGGVPVYKLARSGQEVALTPREVTIHQMECLQQTAENRFLLRVVCSRGTYVRTLCEDIGNYLGTCAHMSFLLRTRSGTFTVAQAYTIPELETLCTEGRLHEAVLPIEQVLSFLPVCTVSEAAAQKLQNGCPVTLSAPMDAGDCRVYGPGFLGIAVVSGNEIKLKLHLMERTEQA